MITAASTAGLDGQGQLENALVYVVDFGGRGLAKEGRIRRNLVACCRPCNTIKGTASTPTSRRPKNNVLAHREELRKAWNPRRRGRLPGRKGVERRHSVRRLVSVEHVQERLSCASLVSDRSWRWPKRFFALRLR